VHRHSSYFSCEADEPLLPQALAYVGNDRIMYASDFPHWDHSYPKSVKELSDRADLGDPVKRQVLAGNARKFYKL
jgi:predicted TIM-barrel fold metal-dependent hydrolase